MKVLVVEDDEQTADYVAKGLREAGQIVDVAHNGLDGLLEAYENYDVLVIDRMLPGLDGLRLVKRLRNEGLRTPILFLTTMGGIDDRVEGLDAGGDDYLVKPFAFTELFARINALARRPPLVGVGKEVGGIGRGGCDVLHTGSRLEPLTVPWVFLRTSGGLSEIANQTDPDRSIVKMRLIGSIGKQTGFATLRHPRFARV